MIGARPHLEALSNEEVAFVVIGGLAMIGHGSSRLTQDLDVCDERSSDNFERIERAMAPFHPRLRDAPPELPFFFDVRTLKSGLNFTLSTDAGSIDFLGEVAGIGGYREAVEDAVDASMVGTTFKILSLDRLERSKRSAGRAKDLLDLAEIAEIRRRLKL